MAGLPRYRLAAAVLLTLALAVTWLDAQSRWSLAPPYGIEWIPRAGDSHRDEMEMSGQRVSVVLGYAVLPDGHAALDYHVIYPWLRQKPNLTNDSVDYRYGVDSEPRIFLDGRLASGEHVTRVSIHGKLTVDSTLRAAADVTLTRTVFPSTRQPAVLTRFALTNHSTLPVTVEVEQLRQSVTTAAARGVDGAYTLAFEVSDAGVRTLPPGGVTTFTEVISGRFANQSAVVVDGLAEETSRDRMVAALESDLQLVTPEPLLNTEFAMAKLRTAESVFRTRNGLMHSPGGTEYYAAAWANDQAEYAAPLFPFLGDGPADEATLNTFHMFSRYVNPAYKPIPSSIIAEGASSWSASGDRGDMAMLAYGAGRFALAYGDAASARELWPLIVWSLEYCNRHVNSEGVVISDSDELEGRFPHGKANLATSSLYYDALNSAAFLARELGVPGDAYAAQAAAMKQAIGAYFAADVQGFAAYRYSEQQNDVLRGWISLPLTMGIFDRSAGTTQALFSPALWGPDGVVVQSGNDIFWDRATLYALRGAFAAGDTAEALDHLRSYTQSRLLGEHVPYPVEQGPRAVGAGHFFERHLAGESALYCRLFTEGLFGMRPAGLHSFNLTPHLPAAWDHMELKRIHAFQHVFDLTVTRTSAGDHVEVLEGGRNRVSQTVAAGATITVNLR